MQKTGIFFRSQEGVTSARVPCYAQKKAYHRSAYKGAKRYPKKALPVRRRSSTSAAYAFQIEELVRFGFSL